MPLSDGPVLIGFAEALAGPESAFSLLDDGRRVAAFTRAGTRAALARAPGVELHPITAPEDDASAAVEELVALARRLGAVAVMPLDDASLWLCDQAAARLDCPVAGPTAAPARIALDKEWQLALAREAGFDVPPTAVAADASAVAALDLPFPYILKPSLAAVVRDGRLTRGGARTIADREGLLRAADAWDATGPRLAQPLLRGTGAGVFGLARPGGVTAWSAHRRLRMLNPSGSGSSACCSAPLAEATRARAERFVLSAGWTGLFMVELLEDGDGREWFMELNGRAWGSMALARRRGLEYPAWTVRDALGNAPASVPQTANGPDRTCRHLGRDLVHLLAVLRGPEQDGDAWPSRWQTARAVLAPTRRSELYNMRPGARGVFLQDTYDTVAGAVRRAAARP